MSVNVKKKTLIIWSVIAGVTVIGLCLSLILLDRARRKEIDGFRGQMSGVWRGAVDDLSRSLSALDLKLQKGLYASTDYQTVSWAAQIFAEAGQARSVLESLPVYDLQLTSTETFLNQAGEYTLQTARKLLRGEALSEQERQTLRQLALRAQELSEAVSVLALRVTGEHPEYDELTDLFAAAEDGEKNDFQRLEDLFAGEEPLTYDGIYSAWHTKRSSKDLEGQPLLSGLELRKAAAGFLGCTPDLLIDGDEAQEPLATREYRNGDNAVTVTLRGGKPVSLIRRREVGERMIDAPRALRMGADALTRWGYPAMEPIRWSVAENLLTAVYALRRDGVLYYADTITLSVALDDGEAVALDATEYLLSHSEERVLPAAIGEEKAREVLRDGLTVTDRDFVCLPCGDGTEKYCYQFTVRDDTETDVLIFVNASTGVEEEIMILLSSEEARRVL